MVARALALILALCSPAWAHGPYSHWVDHNGHSCCSGQDCHPAAARYPLKDGGSYMVMIQGIWCKVPPEAVRPYKSPDGQPHVCENSWKGAPHPCTYILCFVPGTGG